VATGVLLKLEEADRHFELGRIQTQYRWKRKEVRVGKVI
jgi:hypothetical protein